MPAADHRSNSSWFGTIPRRIRAASHLTGNADAFFEGHFGRMNKGLASQRPCMFVRARSSCALLRWARWRLVTERFLVN